jgi:hypothetical protein
VQGGAAKDLGCSLSNPFITPFSRAVCDVPRSLKNEGYEIFEVSPLNETDWAIVVRNKEAE